MSNQETASFTVEITLSDPDGEEGTVPDTELLATLIFDALKDHTDVLYVSASYADKDG